MVATTPDAVARHRLSAVLAADAVGYSRLMAADDVATVAALDRARAIFRDATERHGGRIVDLAGDSVLATFGTALGAVEAAFEVQASLASHDAALPDDRRMRFRVGIHLGDVIEKADGTIYGDGVNIAARLQALAGPGGVVISQSVHTAVHGRVSTTFSDLGEQAVKNIARPVRAYGSGGASKPADAAPRAVGRRRWLAGAVGGTALAVAAGGAWWWARPRAARVDGPTSLAILPFRPLMAEARDEMLEVGMADSLITRLSNLPGVAVRSIASVRRYAGTNQDPLASARELNVQWIVDGSLQRTGDKVRVTSRLLDTSTGEAAWSGSFDEDFVGVFALQDAISTRVAEVLAPHLGGRGRQSLEGVGTTRNVDAYRLYLAARQQAQQIRSTGLGRSIELYRKAIDLDPAFALAFAGIAESYRRTIFGADGEPRVVFAAANEAARRAVALAPTLSEGYASVGLNRFWYDWDWDGAERDFRHALDLNPNDVNAHFGYGQLLGSLGRDDTAQMRMARELDPLSPITLTLESDSLFESGRKDEAREVLQRVFDFEPDFWVAHLARGGMLLADGQVAEGLRSIERAEQFADGSSQPSALLGYALATRGDPVRARGIADRLVALDRERYVPPTSYGVIYAGLGEKELALAALEKAFAVRDTRLTLMRDDPRWSRRFGDEPRYRAVMTRMKFPA